jgi:hypothetical protein
MLNFQAIAMSTYVVAEETDESLRKLTKVCYGQTRKFHIHSTDRRTDKQEVGIGFTQKRIPPYGMPKGRVCQNFKHL